MTIPSTSHSMALKDDEAAAEAVVETALQQLDSCWSSGGGQGKAPTAAWAASATAA